MPHVVTEPCYGCKDMSCIKQCPVDCFHEGEQMLYINPDECIDCTQCVESCPVNAIYRDTDVPSEWEPFIELNVLMAQQTPSIVPTG